MNNKINLLGIDFHFGIGFLSELVENTGMNLIELGSQDSTVLTPKLMYYSRVYACKRIEKEIDFTMNDIFDLIDYNGGIFGDFCNSFNKAFADSMNKNVPIDNDKKKATKKK